MSPDLKTNRPLLDKLGVKPGVKIALVDVDDEAFLALLRTRTTDIARGRPAGRCDLVFVGVPTQADLSRIRDVKGWIEPDGGIWVVRPKGPLSAVRDTDVIGAGLAAGLVDNKIASFSETHSAMRLVFRLRDRPKAGRR